jgi:hypothetical protein
LDQIESCGDGFKSKVTKVEGWKWRIGQRVRAQGFKSMRPTRSTSVATPISVRKLPLDPFHPTVTLPPMRRVLAALLLFCVGILIPASASPVRICFLELGLNSFQADSKCCSDCSQGTEQPDPCCHDLEKLPDSPAPQLPVELPAAVITDVLACLSPAPAMTQMRKTCFPVSAPIRGPTSPAAYRAVLGIWRL